jgi:hypothetical protein
LAPQISETRSRCSQIDKKREIKISLDLTLIYYHKLPLTSLDVLNVEQNHRAAVGVGQATFRKIPTSFRSEMRPIARLFLSHSFRRLSSRDDDESSRARIAKNSKSCKFSKSTIREII